MYIEHIYTTPQRYRALAKAHVPQIFSTKKKEICILLSHAGARALQMEMVTLAEDVKRNATFESVTL